MLCRYRRHWNIDVEFQPTVLADILKETGIIIKNKRIFSAGHGCTCNCVLTAMNRSQVMYHLAPVPGTNPAKFVHLLKDVRRLTEYYELGELNLPDRVCFYNYHGSLLYGIRLLINLTKSHFRRRHVE